MAARALKDLDDAVPPATRALTLDIRTAHRNAGSPSFTRLDSRNIRAGRGTLAKSTLSRILTPDPAAKDQSLPAWSYYEGLLSALDVDPAPFQARWQAAQEEWQARARREEVGEAAGETGGEAAEALAGQAAGEAAGEAAEAPGVRQPAAVGTAVMTPVRELEPRVESAWVLRPVPREVPVRRRYSLPVLLAVVGAGAAVAVAATVGVLALLGRDPARPHTDPPGPTARQATAVLVTDAPPKTVPGRIVRTWNQDADNGHGGSIGVLVFPTPFALNGSTGPHHDGDILEVVCHTEHGRLTHERLDTGHENSTGWFQVYYQDRLWWVADHYISFAGGVQVPDCRA